MKESGKKLTRGQMVYAPITSGERVSRSPFAQSKKITIGLRGPQQHSMQQEPHSLPQSFQQSFPPLSQQSFPLLSQQSVRHPSQSHAQLSPQQRMDAQQIINKSISPYHDYQQELLQLNKQIQQLLIQNQALRSREQIYITKLTKLQEGLERQHEEFMNLQELYTELFNVYKQKEEEIAELELRYKETERQRVDFNSFSRPDHNNSAMSIDKMNSIRNTFIEENFKNQLTQLIFQNKRLNEANQKLISELNYLKSKTKLYESRQTLQQKIVEDLNDWQTQLHQEKEEKIKLQYENKFFKLRNQDLEKTITDLEKVISLKQTEIIKMREDKLNIRRHSSEKVLNRSPPKPNIDSARSKGSNQQNKKYTKLIENLQKENHKLRQDNLQLKQKLKTNIYQKQSVRHGESTHSRFGQSIYDRGGSQQHGMSLHKKLDFGQIDSKFNQDSHRSYQNQNFNSQNINQQYFSFSREREEKYSEEDLPTFPMDLQIQGIIRKHQQHVQIESDSKVSKELQNTI